LAALKHAEDRREHASLKRFAKRDTEPPPFTATGFDGGGDDFLPQYKVGNRTYVNAMANPRVAYYVELKRKFKMTWNPVPPLRRALHQISRGKVETVWGDLATSDSRKALAAAPSSKGAVSVTATR
jgi:hypothetical protein